jgi:hypothetical protein
MVTLEEEPPSAYMALVEVPIEVTLPPDMFKIPPVFIA